MKHNNTLYVTVQITWITKKAGITRDVDRIVTNPSINTLQCEFMEQITCQHTFMHSFMQFQNEIT